MNKKYINIKVVCNLFTITETVEESKCVQRLLRIRNMYSTSTREKTKLKVSTVVANPEIEFPIYHH